MEQNERERKWNKNVINECNEESLSKLSMKNAIAWKPIPKQKIDFILRSIIYTLTKLE